MDSIKQLYETAKNSGLLTEGLTEEMFREQTKDEQGLRKLYDVATSRGMKMRPWEDFRDKAYGQGQYASGAPVAPTATTEPDKGNGSTSNLLQSGSSNAFVPLSGQAAAGMMQREDAEEKEKAARLQREKTAMLPGEKEVRQGMTWVEQESAKRNPRLEKQEDGTVAYNDAPKDMEAATKLAPYAIDGYRSQEDLYSTLYNRAIENNPEYKKEYDIIRQIADDGNEEDAKVLSQQLMSKIVEENQDYIAGQTRNLAQKEFNQVLPGLIEEATINAAKNAVQNYTDSNGMPLSGVYNQVGENYKAAADILQDAKDINDAAQLGGNAWNRFWKGFAKGATDTDTWDFAIGQMKRNARLMSVVNKWQENPNSLTQDEQALLDAWTYYAASMSYNSSSLSHAYKAGNTSAQSIPFMLQFIALNPAAVKDSVVKGIVDYGMKRFESKGAQFGMKMLGHAAGTAAGAAYMTAATGLPKVVAGSMERQTGNIEAGLNFDNNGVSIGRYHEGQGAVEATWNSAVDVFTENASELILADGPIRLAASKRISQMFADSGLRNVGELISRISTNKQFQSFMKRAGYGGNLEELAEEEVNNLMKWAMSTDMHDSDKTFFENAGLTMDDQIDIVLGLLPTSIVMGGSNVLFGAGRTIYDSRMMNKYLEKMQSEAANSLFEQIQNAQNSGDMRDALHKMEDEILANGNLSKKEKVDFAETMLNTYSVFIEDEAAKYAQTAEPTPEEIAQEVSSEIDSQTNEDGKIYGVMLGDQEGFIVGNSVAYKTDENGKVVVDADNSAPYVIIRTADGKVQQVKTADVVLQGEPLDAEQVKREQIAHAEAVSAVKEAFTPGSQIQLKDGFQGFTTETADVVGVDEEGNVTITTDEGNKTLTADEAMAMFQPVAAALEFETVMFEQDGNQHPFAVVEGGFAALDEDGNPVTEKVYTEEELAENGITRVPVETPPAPPASTPYPVRADGKPDWQQMDANQTAQAALEKLGDKVHAKKLLEARLSAAMKAVKNLEKVANKEAEVDVDEDKYLANIQKKAQAESDLAVAQQDVLKLQEALTAIDNIKTQEEIDAEILAAEQARMQAETDAAAMEAQALNDVAGIVAAARERKAAAAAEAAEKERLRLEEEAKKAERNKKIYDQYIKDGNRDGESEMLMDYDESYGKMGVKRLRDIRKKSQEFINSLEGRELTAEDWSTIYDLGKAQGRIKAIDKLIAKLESTPTEDELTAAEEQGYKSAMIMADSHPELTAKELNEFIAGREKKASDWENSGDALKAADCRGEIRAYKELLAKLNNQSPLDYDTPADGIKKLVEYANNGNMSLAFRLLNEIADPMQDPELAQMVKEGRLVDAMNGYIELYNSWFPSDPIKYTAAKTDDRPAVAIYHERAKANPETKGCIVVLDFGDYYPLEFDSVEALKGYSGVEDYSSKNIYPTATIDSRKKLDAVIKAANKDGLKIALCDQNGNVEEIFAPEDKPAETVTKEKFRSDFNTWVDKQNLPSEIAAALKKARMSEYHGELELRLPVFTKSGDNWTLASVPGNANTVPLKALDFYDEAWGKNGLQTVDRFILGMVGLDKIKEDKPATETPLRDRVAKAAKGSGAKVKLTNAYVKNKSDWDGKVSYYTLSYYDPLFKGFQTDDVENAESEYAYKTLDDAIAAARKAIGDKVSVCVHINGVFGEDTGTYHPMYVVGRDVTKEASEQELSNKPQAPAEPAAPAEQKPATPAAPARKYEGKIVEATAKTNEAASKLTALLQQKRDRNKNIGIVANSQDKVEADLELDREILKAGAEYVSALVEQGVYRFADVCANVFNYLDQVGQGLSDIIRNNEIRKMYLNAKVDHPEYRKEMDSEDAIYDFDVENFGLQAEQVNTDENGEPISLNYEEGKKYLDKFTEEQLQDLFKSIDEIKANSGKTLFDDVRNLLMRREKIGFHTAEAVLNEYNDRKDAETEQSTEDVRPVSEESPKGGQSLTDKVVVGAPGFNIHANDKTEPKFKEGQIIYYLGKDSIVQMEITDVNGDGTYNLHGEVNYMGMNMMGIAEDKLVDLSSEEGQNKLSDHIRKEYAKKIAEDSEMNRKVLLDMQMMLEAEIAALTDNVRKKGSGTEKDMYRAIDLNARLSAVLDALDGTPTDPKGGKKPQKPEQNKKSSENILPSQEKTVPLQEKSTVGNVAKDVDTRDNSDLWVVKAEERTDKEGFAELKKRAKAFNGAWSGFKKGFIFRSEDDANKFNDTTVEAPAEKPRTIRDNVAQAIEKDNKKKQQKTDNNGGSDIRRGTGSGNADGNVPSNIERVLARRRSKAAGQDGGGNDRGGEGTGTGGRTSGDVDRLPSVRVSGLNKRNFTLGRGQDAAPTNNRDRYNANVAAIRLLKKLQEEGAEEATKEQQEILSKFSGWGGLGEFFNERNSYRTYNELKTLLTPEEFESANMSRNSAYFTPSGIVDIMWDIARKMGYNGGRFAENSAGIGNVIAHMPADLADKSEISAVEIDTITGGMLKYLYPDAKVHNTGFENVSIPNNSLDLEITNVPFVTGLRVSDKDEKDLAKRFKNLHDFCIAKNIRKLSEGGIGIFITTSGTLDSSRDLRNWIDKEGDTDVIGVFRLNNKSFGGADVTSDIIVVRKRVNGVADPRAINVLETGIVRYTTDSDENPRALSCNKYFIEHPEFMGGEMGFGFEHGDTRWGGTTTQCYQSEGVNQDERLKNWLDSFSEQKPVEKKTVVNDEFANKKEYEKVDTAYSEGELITNKEGVTCVCRGGRAVPLGVNTNNVRGQSKAQCIADYTAIKYALEDLLAKEQETNDDAELAPYLKELNRAYDHFVNVYGSLNKNTAISFLRNDVYFPSIASLESYEEIEDINGKKRILTAKTDVFKKRVLGVKSEVKAANAKDGVILSIRQYGEIRPDEIAGWLGKDIEEVKKEIVESGLGFVDPATEKVVVSYDYLSGNVREKLEYAKEHNADGAYDKNIEALSKVIPTTIPSSFIQFQLGSTWIPVELYGDYVKDRFGIDDVRFIHVTNAWSTNQVFENNLRREKNRAAGVHSDLIDKTISGFEIFMNAINNRPTVFMKKDTDAEGRSVTITDKEASQVASAKADEMRDDFIEYVRGRMSESEELAMSMEKIYNDKFNAIAPKKIGEEFKSATLEGMNPNIKLRPHQQEAVVIATTQPVMLAHEVGTGKTFTMIAAAMEMRRLGTAKKPMIVVQNATVGQFVSSAKLMYPSARVLTVSEKDKSAEGRKEFYAKIKYNDWDLIIVPQSVFDKIPDKEERVQAFIQEKIDEKVESINQAKAANVDSKKVKAMELELKKLQEDFATGNMSGKKSKETDKKKEAIIKQNAAVQAGDMVDRKTDDTEDFDTMGIDALLIDEAHNYKHLGFATTMQRGVKGVDPSYSKRAAALYIKCQSIFERCGHKNIVFATGTPISNTAAEIWTFMKYLCPRRFLVENEIYYFDDFVHNFGRISQSLEFTTSGQFKENSRFASYSNLPELARIWSSIAHTILTKEVGEVKEMVPEMEGGKAKDVFLPQSQTLINIMAYVRQQLKEFEEADGKWKKEHSYIPLVMYGIAKRAAIDPRLVSEKAKDEPDSKTNHVVSDVLQALKDSEKYNGTCAIFCDNYRRLKVEGKKKVETFNIFKDIREKLIKQGVPADQIVIMESDMTIAKKEQIFADINAGRKRVVLGTTATLGTGVNIQERLFFAAHMDAPDRPMDYTQRNGRILRQGNLHKQWGIPVRVVRYGVEDSLDVTGYQRLKTKSQFIDSIMESKRLLDNNLESRSIEEPEEGLFDNPVAVLSGSQYAMLKTQAERELRKLESKKNDFMRQQMEIEGRVRSLERTISWKEDVLEKILEREMKIDEAFPNRTVEAMTVDGMDASTDETKKEAFKAIREKIAGYMNYLSNDRYARIGETKSYDIPFTLNNVEFTLHLTLTKQTGFKDGEYKNYADRHFSISCEHLGIDQSIDNSVDVKNIIDGIISAYVVENSASKRSGKSYQQEIADLRNDVEEVEKRRGMVFTGDAEIDAARKKVEEFTKLMREEMAAKEAKYAGKSTGDIDLDAEIVDEDEDGGDTSFSVTLTHQHRNDKPEGVWKAEVQDMLDATCPIPCVVFSTSDIYNGSLFGYGMNFDEVVEIVKIQKSDKYGMNAVYNERLDVTFVFSDNTNSMDELLNAVNNHETIHEFIAHNDEAKEMIAEVASREDMQTIVDATIAINMPNFYREQYKNNPKKLFEEFIAHALEKTTNEEILLDQVLDGTNFAEETKNTIREIIYANEDRKNDRDFAREWSDYERYDGQGDFGYDASNTEGEAGVRGEGYNSVQRGGNSFGESEADKQGADGTIRAAVSRVLESQEVRRDQNSAKENDSNYSLRKSEMPKVTKVGYACVLLGTKNGMPTMSPKMIAGESVGMPPLTDLDADTARLKTDKSGQLVLNSKGRVQIGEGLAYRPGKHLAEYPNASQFELKSQPGKMDSRVAFVRVEYAADPNLHKQYQVAAWEYGFNANGKYEHTQAGLPYLPKNSYYKYRTNANPDIPSMIITGAYRITGFLTDEEARRLNAEAGGVWLERENGVVIDEAYLKEHGLDKAGLESWAENFPYDMLEEHYDNSAEVLSQAWGYVRRPIDFSNERLLKAIAENGQNVADYQSDYDPNGGGSRMMFSVTSKTEPESPSRSYDPSKSFRENLSALSEGMAKVEKGEALPGQISIRDLAFDAIVKAAQEKRDNHEANRKAIKLIEKNVKGLRKAMRLQQIEDSDAVDRAISIVRVFLRNNWINANDRREIGKILTSINNMTESRNVRGELDNLLDAITTAHLNHVKAYFDKVRRTRAEKIGLTGVTEQGTIDLNTKYRIDAFNECVEAGLDAKKIEALINEDVDNLVEAKDDASRAKYRSQISGYQLAKRYAEKVGALREEELGLRKELKKIEEKSFAGMEHPILAKREAIREAKEAIIDSKFELLDAYDEIILDVEDVMAEGREKAQEFRQGQIDRMNEIRHFANSDLKGIENGEHYKETKWQKIINSKAFAGGLLSPLRTMNSIFKVLARNSPDGRGYLWNHYMRGFIDASENQYRGTKEMFEQLDEKAKELIGGKRTTFADFAEKMNNGKTLKVSFFNGTEEGEPVMTTTELSQGQMAYLYAVNKMTDGKMKIAAMGISEEDMTEITKALDPKVRAMYDWIQEELLPNARTRYNNVYESMFGAPMAAIEHYFPIRVNTNAIHKSVDVNEDEGIGNISGTTTGSILNRVRNSRPLDILHNDAFSIIIDHVQEMEHWAAFAQLNRDMNILLSYNVFKNKLGRMTTYLGAGKKLYDELKRCMAIAVGSYRPVKTDASSFYVSLSKGIASSKIALRLWTAAKQRLSASAFLAEMGEGDGKFMKYYAYAELHPYDTYQWAKKNLPLFEKRVNTRNAGDTRLLDDPEQWSGFNTKVVQLANRVGMAPNAFVDAITCAQGAYAVYRSKKAMYLKRGLSKEDAEKRARQDASIAYNETQQSSEGAFLNRVQMDKDFWSVMVSLFQNANFSYMRRAYEHIGNTVSQVANKTEQMEYLTKQIMRTYDVDEDIARKMAKTDYRKSLSRNIFGSILDTYILQALWRLGGNLFYLIFGGLGGDDDDTWWNEEKSRIVKDALTGGAFSGLLRGSVAGAGIESAMDGFGIENAIDSNNIVSEDLAKYFQELKNGKWVEFGTDIINMIIAAGIGVDVKTISNIAVGAIDAFNGDMKGAHEAILLIARIMAVPEKQQMNLYIDELGSNAKEVSDAVKYNRERYNELMERYANYKKMQNAPILGAFRNEENEQTVTHSAENEYKRAVNNRQDNGKTEDE